MTPDARSVEGSGGHLLESGGRRLADCAGIEVRALHATDGNGGENGGKQRALRYSIRRGEGRPVTARPAPRSKFRNSTSSALSRFPRLCSTLSTLHYCVRYPDSFTGLPSTATQSRHANDMPVPSSPECHLEIVLRVARKVDPSFSPSSQELAVTFSSEQPGIYGK